MKKYFIIVLVSFATTAAFAQKKQSKKSPPPTTTQDSTTSTKTALAPLSNQTTTAAPPAKAKKDWSKVNISKRAADHFMFQLGYDNWAGVPDSIHIKGFNHSVNFYFMFDIPFKTDKRLSIGAGLGIGSSNVLFDHQEVMVAAYQNTTLAFPVDQGNHFKTYKLTTVSLEAPVELRYAVDPEHMDQSWKFALGIKIGLLLSAYTKGKDLQNQVGQTIGNYSEKESSKMFFNTTHLIATARISKGVIGLFGQIQANSLIKSSAGPSMFPFSMGITLSGL